MRTSSIEMRDLRLLAALLAEKSVSRAAARVGLTQPAASNGFSRLRARLGDPLFVRSGRGITLTPRALALGPTLERALGDLDRAIATPSGFDPRTSDRTFTIAATDFGEFVLLAPLLKLLVREAPNVRVRVLPLGPAFPMGDLEAGRLDLVIGSFRAAPPHLYRRVLFTESSVSLMRKDHPATKKRLTLEAFAALDHVLISPRGDATGILDDLLAARGLTRRVVATVPHFLAAAFLVLETDLVVTLAARVAQRFVEMVPLSRVALPVGVPKVTIAALWHERTLDDPAEKWLRAKLTAIARSV